MTRSLANIRIRGTVYHFRRRVPPALTAIVGQVEIVRSLRTSVAREARQRAAILWTATDRAFDLMSRQSLAAEQVAAILRRLREEPLWESPTATELVTEWRDNDETPLNNFIKLAPDQIRALPESDRRHLIEHYAALARQVEMDELVIDRDFARAEAMHARRQAEGAATRAVVAERVAYAAVGMAVAGGAVPAPMPLASRSSPMFSENIEAFIADKRVKDDDGQAYTEQTVKQVRATFRLWVELIGEKPVREYTGEDAGKFRTLILQLPFSHGKSGKPIHALEAIEGNKVLPVPKKTITMKTAKRHFSAMMQYWKWLKPRGHVSEVIFSGFEFRGTKSNKKRRDDWSPEDLERLFLHEPWFGSEADRKSAYYWLPLVALYSGMREEEIARLRPEDDIKEQDGVPCIFIQPHPDGWTPKTEAGERVVPIHSALIGLGFLDFVEGRRKKKAARVFGDLVPGGPDGKYSYTFSREFSRAKIHKLGVGEKTVFHSFRHSVRTILDDAEAVIRDSWIDAVMGHDGSDTESQAKRQSEGVKTYLKRVGVHRMVQVVEAIIPPVDVPRLLKRDQST